jgi:hypothetical protein
MASILMLDSEYFLVPVKAGAGLVILPTTSGYLNDGRFYYVVGEVQNTGDTAVTDVYVNATFYNFTGDVVAEISQPTRLYTLLPGRISPFDITLFSTIDSQKVYNYTVRIVQSSTTQNGQVGLMIVSNSSSLDSNGFHISGTIKNIGAQNISFTRIIATFYNATDARVHAIAALANYSDPSSLRVNQTAPFEILLNASEASQVDHYVLEAEAYDSDLIPDYELVPEFQPMLFVSTLLILTTTIGLVLKHFLKKKHAAPRQAIRTGNKWARLTRRQKANTEMLLKKQTSYLLWQT